MSGPSCQRCGEHCADCFCPPESDVTFTINYDAEVFFTMSERYTVKRWRAEDDLLCDTWELHRDDVCIADFWEEADALHAAELHNHAATTIGRLRGLLYAAKLTLVDMYGHEGTLITAINNEVGDLP